MDMHGGSKSMSALTQNAHPELRRVALALHALEAEDQSWMLGSLEPNIRPGLQALLQELQTLGIPKDGQLLREALDWTPTAQLTSPVAKLETMAPAHLWQAIQREPVTVQVICLSILSPELHRLVLRHASASVQNEQASQRHTTPEPLAPALKAALEGVLLEAAQSMSKDTATEIAA
jgi:flagellar motor switch protein FliG